MRLAELENCGYIKSKSAEIAEDKYEKEHKHSSELAEENKKLNDIINRLKKPKGKYSIYD